MSEQSATRLLEERRVVVEGALRDVVRRYAASEGIAAAARYALESGGKRLRPVLALCAVEAVRGSAAAGGHAAMARAACSVELVHTYSLVHDDLPCMDDDDLRRGRPTVHRVYGTASAMVAGFGLIPMACRVLLDGATDAGVPAGTRLDAARELCVGAGAAGMVGGQVLDLEAEQTSPGVDGLRRVHSLKTGALFSAALRIGAVLAGGSREVTDALGGFGARLGLAFQITDDILDVTMDAGALGKTPGKDAAAAKATFVSALGLEGARRAAGAEAEQAVASLSGAGIAHPLLEALARVAVQRDR